MMTSAPKPYQEVLETEILDVSKRCSFNGFNLLVIDTENMTCLFMPVQALMSEQG